MILGTPRIWWIAAAIPLVLGLALFVTGTGGAFSGVAGILLILLAMILFAAAPMRYGREKPGRAKESAANVAPPEALAVDQPPQPRPTIEARDASDV